MSARIPFALVGVLLLVGSATFAGSLGGPTVTEPSVDRAMDRTEAATQSAVRTAVTHAATETARHPVTAPASDSFGSVLDNGDTLRDSLRLRVYVAVRDRLDRIGRTSGDVQVTASLPGTDSPEALAGALDRVSVSRAGSEGTDLEATVQNVTLTAKRDGQVIGERSVSPTVTVPVPTLAVHDRVSRFQRLLNASPGEAGLGSRLTGKLYALTWTRGFAQFGGAPIENVVTNRHLSLLTNTIALSMQREQFGASDPRGRSLLKWATAHTAISDAIIGSPGRMAARLQRTQDYAGLKTLPSELLSNSGATDPSTDAGEKVTLSLEQTAHSAFFNVSRTLNRTLDETYDARVQLRQRLLSKSRQTVKEPREPEANWTLADTKANRSVSVSDRSAPEPAPDTPWHLLEYHPRQVTIEDTITRVWETPDGRETTVEVSETSGSVDIVLVGRHDGGPARGGPFERVHEPGGALGGPNLAGVEQVAMAKLVDETDIDTLAIEGFTAGGKTSTATVAGKQPDDLYEYVYTDLMEVRERVRNISATTTRGKLATMQVNPGNRLLQNVRDEWSKLLSVPDRYRSVADRARYNARIAYLRTVVEGLQDRADQHEQSVGQLDGQMNEQDVADLGNIQSDYADRGKRASSDSLGVRMRVETAPSYLTLGKLDGKSVPTLPPNTTTHPLVAENVNYFTVPYGDVAKKISEEATGPREVSLDTAVKTLESARSTDDNTALQQYADTLEAEVQSATGYLAENVADVVAGNTPARDGDPLVTAALERYDTAVALGHVWTNGTAVERIHEEVRSRYALSTVQSDKLKRSLRMWTGFSLGRSAAKPSLSTVNGTAKKLRTVLEKDMASRLGSAASSELKRQLERQTGRSLSRLPAGLPVAPPLLPWVTTVNYWSVQVRGEYTRFTVTVPRGTPDNPGARLRYVRSAETVSLDVDEDGKPERLGRTTPITFRTHGSVAIAVPPKPRGVGDVNGVMNEQSPGWPHPG